MNQKNSLPGFSAGQGVFHFVLRARSRCTASQTSISAVSAPPAASHTWGMVPTAAPADSRGEAASPPSYMLSELAESRVARWLGGAASFISVEVR